MQTCLYANGTPNIARQTSALHKDNRRCQNKIVNLYQHEDPVTPKYHPHESAQQPSETRPPVRAEATRRIIFLRFSHTTASAALAWHSRTPQPHRECTNLRCALACFGYIGREPFSGILSKDCDGSHFFWTLVFQLVLYDNVNVEVHALRCIMYDPVAAIGFVDHSLAGYSQGIAWVLVSRFLVRPSCSFFQSAPQKLFPVSDPDL